MSTISHNIGILGDGQLGRMLALAGYPLGQRFGFLGRADSPAGWLGRHFAPDALEALIDWADVITYESENTDVALVRRIEAAGVPVYPGAEALYHSQHRLREKTLFNSLGIPTAPFRAVHDHAALMAAVEALGTPAILKTTTEGYDGKGQYRLHGPEDVAAAWQAIGEREAILEGFVRFRRELSIIAVRGRDGDMVFYPLVENRHHAGILRLTRVPAPDVSMEMQALAQSYMEKLMDRLNYIGVLTLELFETDEGLLANEMAPRVHNSGHWTIEGAGTSQFENHVRAITGLPLGSTNLSRPYSAMVNIIGEEGPVETVLAQHDMHLHLYDKAEQPRRKLGHITVLADEKSELDERLCQLHSYLSDDE